MRRFIEGLSPRAEFFAIIALCFGYFSLSSLATLFFGIRDFRMTTARTVRGIVVELSILAAAGAILHVRGWTVRRLGFRFSWKAFLAGIPLFIAYILLYWGVFLLTIAVYPPARNLQQSVRLIPAAPFALFAVFIVVNSLFEEAAVTGYVVTALSEQGGQLAITASALIRFAYHLYQGPIASIAVLPLGLLFGAVFWRWRNVWPLIIAHTVVNFFAFSGSTNAQH